MQDPTTPDAGPARRYRALDADAARWEGFEFRQGDIVIDAPSKSGTTWTQLLVALLLFGGPDLPEPLGRLSPWMEQRILPREEVHELLGAQQHRRFIKSHTPLDGIPSRPEVTYVCVGRDPRDAAVSMWHHAANIDRTRLRTLLAAAATEPLPPPSAGPPSLDVFFDEWIDTDDPDAEWSLPFLVHHYATFWERRHEDNVALFHFTDYLHDLPAELTRLARHLGVQIEDDRATMLAAEASLDRSRQRAPFLAPDTHFGFWKDPTAFFRSGGRGEWRDVMTAAQQERYRQRLRQLAAPELAHWMHHGGYHR